MPVVFLHRQVEGMYRLHQRPAPNLLPLLLPLHRLLLRPWLRLHLLLLDLHLSPLPIGDLRPLRLLLLTILDPILLLLLLIFLISILNFVLLLFNRPFLAFEVLR